MEELSRKREALIKSLYSKHVRKKSDCCICEGVRCCTEVFLATPELVEFTLITPELKDSVVIPAGEVIECSSEQIGKFGSTVNNQGILSVVRRPSEPTEKTQEPFVLVLDRVADPGNFGTILRTARAAGIKELWYTVGSADPYNDKVIRSALGAMFSMKLRKLSNLDSAIALGKEFGFNELWLTDPHQGANCYLAKTLFERTLLVIGNEADGIGADVLGNRVTIPMPGEFESLNAAQAATIFIFEYVRRNYE